MTRTSIAGFAIGALAIGLVAAGASYSVMGPNDTRIVTPVSVDAADTRATDGPTDGPSDGPSDGPTDDSRDDPGVDASPSPSSPSTRTPTPRATDDDSRTSVAVPAGVTLDRARAIALGAVNGTVREAKLDDEDGRTVWEVELIGKDRAKWEVTIDAVTGKILETERY